MGFIWRNHDVFIAFFVNNNKNLFCSHILLCNILTVILRPEFEEPLDTAKQLVEQNITIYREQGFVIWKLFLQESSIPEYKILGENMILVDGWDNFENMTIHDVMGAGTHAQMTNNIYSYYRALGRRYHPEGRGWYRSKEKVAGVYPYGGYLSTKKWHLNEASK